MANSETSFKKEIRDPVKREYSIGVHMWNTTDLFIAGIPDTMLTYGGISIGWEAKFVHKLPVRDTSNVLKHTVSVAQLKFLHDNIVAGGMGFVVVGSPDDALFMSPRWFDPRTGNISKDTLMKAMTCDDTIRVPKIDHVWCLGGILDKMLMLRGKQI